MEFVRKLLLETDYLKQMKKLESLEEKRRFCRHGLDHALDVARLVWIKVLEKQYAFEKEEIYLAALLHDIGRISEYQEGIPHQEAGVKITKEFLTQIGYPKERQLRILEAIEKHREKGEIRNDFMSIMKEADSRSRNCFFCEVSQECKWSEERKNSTIVS